MNIRPRRPIGLMLGVFLASSCGGPSLDITTALVVKDVTTGWLDVGFDSLGRNKLVPTLSFVLENVSDDRVRTLQLNGVFRRCLPVYQGQEQPVSEVSPADPVAGTCTGEDAEWGNAFMRAVGREGVPSGTKVGPFTMESGLGYTGEQPRQDMLGHRDFVDAKIELFAKHRAEQWVKMGEFQIDRQLLTQ